MYNKFTSTNNKRSIFVVVEKRLTQKRKLVSMFSRQIQHWKSSVQGSLGRFLSEQIEFQEKGHPLRKAKEDEGIKEC